MTLAISQNTQAILLLTAPLIAGRGQPPSELLTPGEYNKLARRLKELHREPEHLFATDSAELRHECRSVVAEDRLQRLLDRGFLLSQAVQVWQDRAIWVMSRADSGYPKRYKERLREQSPAVIYGCGDKRLLAGGGLAVVGSRHPDQSSVDYATGVGSLAARAGKPIVSGCAKGIDQAAMRGALEEGGRATGVLANGLARAAVNRDNRNLLLDGRLVLVSHVDPCLEPSGRVFVGYAMQRNKLIYALADAALVVKTDLGKGGTWAGAVEQLEKHKFLCVYVRPEEVRSPGLDGLRKKGAKEWPEPRTAESFRSIVELAPTLSAHSHAALDLFGQGAACHAAKGTPAQDTAPAVEPDKDKQSSQDVTAFKSPPSREVAAVREASTTTEAPEPATAEERAVAPEPASHATFKAGAARETCAAIDSTVASEAIEPPQTNGAPENTEAPDTIARSTGEGLTPRVEVDATEITQAAGNVQPTTHAPTAAEQLFALARELILQRIDKPMTDAAIAADLGVQTSQAKAWLKRLVEKRELKKSKSRPVTYTLAERDLFGSSSLPRPNRA